MIEVKNLRQGYKYYKTEIAPKTTIDINLYLKITQGFMKFQVNKLLQGYDVELGVGESLGTLRVREYKSKAYINEHGEIKGVPPSWSKTKKLWDSDPVAKANRQLVYCFNEHSDGNIYSVKWYTGKSRLYNKQYYHFKLSRANKRALNRLINQGKEYAISVKRDKSQYK